MRIGERLIAFGLITQEQLEQALEHQKEQKERKKVVRILVDLGFATEDGLLDFFVTQCKNGNLDLSSVIEDFPANEDDLLQKIATVLDMGYVDLSQVKIDLNIVDIIPFALMKKFMAIPYLECEKEIYIALTNPFDPTIKEGFLKAVRKKELVFDLAKKERVVKVLGMLEINESIKDLTDKIKRELKNSAEDSGGSGESSSITKLIEIIFAYAVKNRSSDIHIEANEQNCIVRCRIDGVLNEAFVFEKEMFPPLSSRIKLLSNLDIAEKRKPQDGRFSQKVEGNEFDFRISTLPIITGESIVIRILDKSKALVKLEEMGMSEVNYNRFMKCIKTPYGIVFVTGPTGSGKTTTLYASINKIKGVGEKIITVEDPVEYQMDLIQQVMVNEKAGLTFAGALRSILRQDPDIIMIGEIRDQETLRIAIQAALTGHLVFSTLHTNDAISAVSRLMDMGIESFFVASSMAGIEAQRLIRKICQECKYEIEVPENIMAEIRPYVAEGSRFYKARGCPACNLTGFSGRELISEILIATETIKKLIIEGASKETITQEARKDGFITMFEDGLSKASRGLTTLEEIYRVAKLP